MDWVSIIGAAAIGMAGTGLGAWISPRRESLVKAMGLGAAGIMLAVASLELLPQAMAFSGTSVSFLAFAAGVALVVALSGFSRHDHGNGSVSWRRGGGMLVLFSLALHNLPEGLSIGAGFSAAPQLGMRTALAVALHIIPEGMALGALLRRDGMSRTRSIFWAAFSGFPMALGAFLGQWLAGSALGVGGCLALAAGAMVYVVAAEILPEGYDHSPLRWPGLWVCLGFFVGLAGLVFI